MKPHLTLATSVLLAFLVPSCDPDGDVSEDVQSFDIEEGEIDVEDSERPDAWEASSNPTLLYKCWCIARCSSNPPHWTTWKNVGYVKGTGYTSADKHCKQQSIGFCKAKAWDYTHSQHYCG